MKRFALLLTILLVIPGAAFAGSGVTEQSAADFVVSADSGANASNGSPSIAWDGTNFFMVWINGTDIYGARVSPDGDVLDPAGIPLSIGLNGSTSGPRPPSVAFDGTNYLVVWVSTRGGATEVYGCRVAPDGTVLDPAGLKITQGGSPKVKPVGIAFNGSEYFIVWRTTSDIVRGIRVGTDGAAIGDTAGFQVMSWGFYPSVAYDAADGVYLVAAYHNASSGYSIHCARVGTDGTVLDSTPITLCDAGGNSTYPRVAFDGDNFMVVWADSRSDASGQNGSIYGARVSPSGDKLGGPFLIGYRVIQNTFPNIVFDGTDYLVTWSSTNAANWVAEKFRLPDAYAARISTDGVVLDSQAVPLCTAFAHQAGVSVAYGAGRYFAAWDDLRHSFNGGKNAIRGRIFEKGFDSLQTAYEPQALPAQVTWMSQSSGLDTGAASGVATDSNTAWLFGTNNSTALRNGSWSVDSAIGGKYSGYAVSNSDIWAGGWAGFIKNNTDGTWSDLNPNSGSPLITGIWGNSHDDVWASLSYVNAFTHFDGSNWHNVASACSGDMQDIMGSGPGDIWSVGERGAVQHWDGEKWSAVTCIPTLQTLNSVWVNGPDDAFAVGDHGVILHWNGVAWSAQTSPTAQDLKDVWAADSSHVYAVGYCGTVLRYNGASWSRENAGTTNDLLTVFGGFNSDGTCKLWAAGYGSAVYSKTISVTSPVTAVPENFRLTSAGSDAVTLGWTLPDDRNVTGYALEYRAEGETDWTVKTIGRVSSYTAAGLDNSKSYAFRLKAQYRYVYYSDITGEISGRVLGLKVRFNSQGGSEIPDCLVNYGGQAVRPGDPTQDGKYFFGWFTDISCAPDKEWNFDTPVTADLELFAGWLDGTVYVQLDTWDGRPPTDIPVARGTAMAKPEDPKRDGHTFVDWYTGLDYGTPWNFGTPVTENITLYAKWKPDADIVNFRLDTWDGRPPTDIPVEKGSVMAKPEDPKRGGYTFVDWYLRLDYGPPYDFSTPVTENVTVYAKWANNTYTVEYDANGGSGTTSSSTHVYDETKRLTANGFTMPGYAFKGWSMTRTGSVAYSDEAEVTNLTTVNNGVVTLFAVWEEKIYTVSAAANYGSYGSVSGVGYYSYGDSVELRASPYPGYRFLRWAENDATVSINAYYTLTVSDDICIMAEFAPVTPLALGCTKTNVTLYGGNNGALQISASGGDTGTYEYSINGGVSWQSGKVFSGLAAGTYTAAVRDAGYPDNIATCSATISEPKYTGSFAAGRIPSSVKAGTAISIISPPPPKGYTVISVTYSSSNPTAAAADANGRVTFLAGGRTTIITTVKSQMTDSRGRLRTNTATVKKSITVIQPVASISLNMYSAAITRTHNLKLTAYILPATASSKSVTWKSGNTRVASVSSSGVVTGKAAGTAIITCTAKDGSGVSASCTITVNPIYPTALKLSKTAVTIKTGKTYALKGAITPGNTDFKALVWQSSNPAVATVDHNGKIRGVAPGTAVISTTTCNGIAARCTVTVK